VVGATRKNLPPEDERRAEIADIHGGQFTRSHSPTSPTRSTFFTGIYYTTGNK
jgi:hypothetical protein